MSQPREPIRDRMDRLALRQPENAVEEVSATAPVEAQTDPVHRVTRESRKPFGSTDQKLAWPIRPGYHNHWFNDDPGRIQTAKDAGYEHVQDYRSMPVSRVVGVAPGGGPLLAYLMEVPQEWWEEDQARQQKLVDTKMDAIRRGYVDRKDPKDNNSFYAGSDRGQIDIRETSKRDPR